MEKLSIDYLEFAYKIYEFMLLQIIYFSWIPYNNVMKKYSKGLGKKEEKGKFKPTRHIIELISLPQPLFKCLLFGFL